MSPMPLNVNGNGAYFRGRIILYRVLLEAAPLSRENARHRDQSYQRRAYAVTTYFKSQTQRMDNRQDQLSLYPLLPSGTVGRKH